MVLLCRIDGSDATFLFSLYHKIAGRARGIIKTLFARAKSFLTSSLFTITYYFPKNPYTPN